MELVFSITELSNLTGKTRPTLYKYMKAYIDGSFDDLPYSFIQLFNLMDKKDVNRKLSYSNYEDRIRMAAPAKLDSNGLYVSLMQAVGDNDIKRAKNLITRGAKLNSSCEKGAGSLSSTPPCRKSRS